MRAVVQRVTAARVRVGEEVVGEIGRGLCALVGVTHTDTEHQAAQMARRLAGLRLFPDEAGTMNVPVIDAAGSLLVVSQFTLYGDTSRGRRPSWSAAAPAAYAEPLVDAVAFGLRELGLTVATGRFGATMQVELLNDGPVTVLVET
jgi:D-tyrosyl-tRNA(Tyr) deacylase